MPAKSQNTKTNHKAVYKRHKISNNTMVRVWYTMKTQQISRKQETMSWLLACSEL